MEGQKAFVNAAKRMRSSPLPECGQGVFNHPACHRSVCIDKSPRLSHRLQAVSALKLTLNDFDFGAGSSSASSSGSLGQFLEFTKGEG